MNRDEYEELFETLQLDKTLPITETIRRTDQEAVSSGPTLAFSDLPSVDLRGDTNPELELGETIGEGGMGVVRSARQLALRREVAVKTLRPGRESKRAVEGLLHEALVSGTLEHPNIVPVYSLGQTENGAPIIVMKRIEGVPWSRCIADIENAPVDDIDDPLGWQLDVAHRVCLALEFAHARGILHRDIKPENVMIGEYGEVYLLDWGVAVTTDPDKADYLSYLGDSPGVVGTPGYMAPEMTTGDPGGVGPHTDVYLLAATLYHVLVGQPPHDGNSLFEVMFQAYESKVPEFDESVPDGLAAICRRGMAREPGDRFESVAEFRRELTAFSRHRASISLAEQATERLDLLEEMVRGGAAEEQESRIRNLFGECRFGFGEALRIWPENPDARAGETRAIELIAEFEVNVGNLKAADGWVDQLDDPPQRLVDEVEALRERLHSQAAEIAELREMRDEFDLSTGAGLRARAALVGAIFFSLMPLAAELYWRLVDNPMQGSDYYVMHSGLVIAFIGGVIFLVRKEVFANIANRRIIRMLVAYGAWTFVFRLTSHLLGVPPLVALTMETTVYALVFAAVAIMSEWWAWFGFTVYAVAAVLSAMHPRGIFLITAVANFVAIGWIGWIWSRQEVDGEKPAPRSEPSD